QGKLVPGQIAMKNPVATFFEANGRKLELRGDRGVVISETVALVGRRSKSALRITTVSGNAKLTLSPPSDSVAEIIASSLDVDVIDDRITHVRASGATVKGPDGQSI